MLSLCSQYSIPTSLFALPSSWMTLAPRKVDKTSGHRGTARGKGKKRVLQQIYGPLHSLWPLLSVFFESLFTYWRCQRSCYGLFLSSTFTLQPVYSKCIHFNSFGCPPRTLLRHTISNHVTLLTVPLKE